MKTSPVEIPLWERIAIFSTGVMFLIVLLILAIFFPEPTQFQYTIFRVTLALAAAGFAALIPGFIQVSYKNAMRAGGALAVFVIVYFCSPAGLVITSTPLQASQLQDLRDLNAFIGGKDEEQIREVFDFPGIVKFNIALDKKNIAPDMVTKEEFDEISSFFMGGQSIISTVDGKYIRYQHGQNGEIRAALLPNRIGLVFVSKKYVANKAALLKYEDNPFLPKTIRDAVTALDNAVEANAALLLDVINKKFAEDPKNLLYEYDPSSEYFAATSSAYFDKFLQLKPIVDKILDATSKYLNVD